jgi:hypothetical protein
VLGEVTSTRRIRRIAARRQRGDTHQQPECANREQAGAGEVTAGEQMHDRIASLRLTEEADLCSTHHWPRSTKNRK